MNQELKRSILAAVVCGILLASATSFGADRPDAWLTTKAKVALMTAEGIDSVDISIDTINGRVTLSGVVDSVDEKQRAQRVVREIEGVREVRSLLTVAPVIHQQRDTRTENRISDDELKEQVEDAFEDWGLDEVEVEVESVENGVVVLEGGSDTLYSKQRAVALVRNFPGVVRVVDRIDEPETASADWDDYNRDAESDERSVFEDAWITTQVKLKLMARDDVPALDVNVDTYDRKVTLFGIVRDESAKGSAEAAARQVDDVELVQNDIQVVPDSRREVVDEQDETVAVQIEEALDASTWLEDADIHVEVKNGVARLTGELEGESQRLAAVTLARSIVGVKAVENDLRVRRTT